MKKTVKFFAAFLSVFLLCFSAGCASLKAWWEDINVKLIPPSLAPSTTFTVEYDYGGVEEGKATLLLNGSSLFFDPENYSLSPLIAGDEIKVSYDGELLIQETYPSTIVVQGKLVGIEKTKSATVMNVTFNGIEEGKILVNGYTFDRLPAYIIEEDGSMTPLTEVEVGASLSIACHFDCEGEDALALAWQPTAIYGYDPLV